MLQVSENGLMVLKFKNLSGFKGVSHCITTRTGGFSRGLYDSLNLSFNVGDDNENVVRNREKVSSLFESDKKKLFIPSQCHTNHVKLITELRRNEDLTETDALISNEKGLILAVMAADCVPILLYDPVNNAVAAIHAGWKGTVRNIVSVTINDMVDNFNSNPVNLVAGIGPCISTEVYEVGEEVKVEFDKLFGNNPKIIFSSREHNKSYINLSEANRQLLIQNGVKDENIEIAGICTFSNPGLLFSARRDGNKCGRFASAIMLNN